jgi:hypothetical protein
MIAQPDQRPQPWRPIAVLLCLLAPALLASAAFVLGLLLNDALDRAWTSDWRFVGCFGLAFALGAATNLRIIGPLAREGSLVRVSMLLYAIGVVVFSFILVEIIHDLRSEN